jgi:hypothetical protein
MEFTSLGNQPIYMIIIINIIVPNGVFVNSLGRNQVFWVGAGQENPVNKEVRAGVFCLLALLAAKSLLLDRRLEVYTR